MVIHEIGEHSCESWNAPVLFGEKGYEKGCFDAIRFQTEHDLSGLDGTMLWICKVPSMKITKERTGILKPRSKDFHWRHYKNLLKSAGLPDIRWYDLRSTYCTLLLKSDFNPKAVSRLMGHAKELITMDRYGDNQNIIPEKIPELLAYMDEVMPKKKAECGIKSAQLDTVIDIEEYLSDIGSGQG